MSNDAVAKMLGSFGGQLGLVNAGMGAMNADGFWQKGARRALNQSARLILLSI
jgi:hypothetical protein